MQLVRIPAFAPYLWFCLKFQAPLQPVFLILVYLKYNKNYGSSTLGRHFVDEVIDLFSSSDDLSVPQEKETHYNPSISNATLFNNRQALLPWRRLADLRSKIDNPHYEEQHKLKPVTPTRCELVPPAIALRAMSLSTNEKSKNTSSPTIPAIASRNQTFPPAPNGPLFQTLDILPLVNEQLESGDGSFDVENDLLDVSDVEAWCSSLTRDSDPYPQKDPDVTENVHNKVPTFDLESEAGDVRFNEIFKYFNH